MAAHVTRRRFLKQSAFSVLTAFGSGLPNEPDALQLPPRSRENQLSPAEIAVAAPAGQHGPPGGYQILERVTYVCGRGEVENYFRTAPKPQNYEQNLESNCQLRAS